MNKLKRLAGSIWIAAAALALWLMIRQANLEFGKSPALDTRIFWYTIVPIFLPIMGGLGLFGWYCLKGEYDRAEE